MRQKGWGVLQPSENMPVASGIKKDGHAHVSQAVSQRCSSSACAAAAAATGVGAAQSILSRLAVTTPRTFGCEPTLPVRGLRAFSDLPVDLPVQVDLAKSTCMWNDAVRLILTQ